MMNEYQSPVVPSDPQWKAQFDQIKASLLRVLDDLVIAVEHVGSTSVLGLPAKPVIDIDAIYEESENLPKIIDRLTSAGYRYLGNLGIEGREAFKAPPGTIRHNFYVCRNGCVALRNHLLLRDHLRSNPGDREKYGALKMMLAPLYLKSPDLYVEGKTRFIIEILEKYGMSEEDLIAIQTANTAKKV